MAILLTHSMPAEYAMLLIMYYQVFDKVKLIFWPSGTYFWPSGTFFLTKLSVFSHHPLHCSPLEHKKTLLLSSILFFWENPYEVNILTVCSPQTYFFRGKSSEPTNTPPPLHAIVNTFPRIYFLFVPLIDGRFLSCTKLPNFQPQALPSSPNPSQRRLQALQKWRCLCVNSEKRSSANKCK